MSPVIWLASLQLQSIDVMKGHRSRKMCCTRKLQVTSGNGKLKMAVCGCWRFAWFCIFCVFCLGLGVGLSYPGKTHCKYVVGCVFCYYKCRLGVTGCLIWKFTVYLHVRSTWERSDQCMQGQVCGTFSQMVIEWSALFWCRVWVRTCFLGGFWFHELAVTRTVRIAVWVYTVREDSGLEGFAELVTSPHFIKYWCLSFSVTW
jgi:hypothetical protein